MALELCNDAMSYHSVSLSAILQNNQHVQIDLSNVTDAFE